MMNGNRGGRILVLDDYRFQKNKITKNRIHWRCSIKSCGAYLTSEQFDTAIDDNKSFKYIRKIITIIHHRRTLLIEQSLEILLEKKL